MANTRLYRTQATGTSRQKWTLSMWFKKCAVSGHQGLMSTNNGWQDGSGMSIILEPSGILNIYNPVQDETGTYNQSTRKFNDTNAYYHFVFSADSTQATQADRLKIYVNGEQLSYSTSSLPSQNIYWHDLNYSGQVLNIGSGSTANEYFDGIMSHVHFADGTAYAPTVFGETDAVSGEWKIIADPTFTLGINGFTILKDGNTITDQSTNSNDFTSSGAGVTKTEDNPSDVFATLNPLDKGGDVNTVINGNTSATWNATNGHTIRSTLAVSKGKYYWELNNANNLTVGIVSTEEPIIPTSGNLFPGGSGFGTGSYSYRLTDGYKGNNNTFSSYGSAITTSDILGCALDLDNGKIYWSENGVWQNSGDPANGTNPAFTGISSDKTWSPAYGYVGGGANTLNVNYGNGYLGTTAISSAGTNASGIGIFEYDVPTGYTALSTKGLNS